MAHVPVTINGVVYPKNKKDPPQPVTIVGYAWITGLGVGGGPIPPGDLPPDVPPDVIWGGGNEPFPTPPIEIPPPDLPPDVSVPKPPPPEGGWAWGPNVGWVYVPGSGSPGPKRR